MASYFCLSDGTVVHTVAGQMTPQQFLREARWATEIRKLAVTEAGGEVARYRASIRKAHVERLMAEYGVNLPPNSLPRLGAGTPPVPTDANLRKPGARGLGTQGQVHLVLAYSPLPKLATLYPIVFEDILKERVSTLPVRTH